MKILVIEDECEICQRIEGALKNINFQVCDICCVESLHRASNVAITYNPSIIILDLTLPDSSPLDTIKRIPDFDAVAPVVILTGKEQYHAECIDAGAMNYLQKLVYLRPGYEAFLAHALLNAKMVWKKRSQLTGR